jgi:hypothetical protein
VLGRCDDSSGLFGDLFRQAMGQLARITEAAPLDPAPLAEQVFEGFCDNGTGVFDGVIAQLKQALGPEGLALLNSQFEQLAEQPVPVPPRQEWQQVGWGSGGPTYAHEREASSRQWTVRLGLRDVATAMGDIDAYIAQTTPEQQRFPRIATGIARRLLAVGRPEDALIALTKATPDRSRWPEMEWEDTHIDTLEALARQDEAQAARWSLFARSSRYGHAAHHLQSCERLSQRIADWEEIPSHDAYLAAIRQNHARKSGFW